jgi:hypothetical protein
MQAFFYKNWMRRFFFIVLILVITTSYGQNGYIKLLKNDSILTGFLKPYISAKDGEPGIEL